MQATIRKARLQGKSKRMEEIVKREITNRLMTAVDYLADEVPVDTGAYARSMHLNPRGDRSGHGETSHRKPRGVDANSERAAMADRLYASLEAIDVLDGATFVNNAPHARYVEGKWGVFDVVRSILK